MNEDFNQYEYEVVDAKEGDATGSRIEKRGIKADFTIAEMRSQQLKCEKIVTELTGKLALETDKAENIKQHHPEIAAMSMEDLFAAKMYYECMALVNGLPPKIKEMQDAVDESKAEEAHIIATLGLTFPEPATPAETLVDTAMQDLEKGDAKVEAVEPAPEAPAAE